MLPIPYEKAAQVVIKSHAPKGVAKLDPASLLTLAKLIYQVLAALGVKLPAILDFLKASGLPDPTPAKK